MKKYGDTRTQVRGVQILQYISSKKCLHIMCIHTLRFLAINNIALENGIKYIFPSIIIFTTLLSIMQPDIIEQKYKLLCHPVIITLFIDILRQFQNVPLSTLNSIIQCLYGLAFNTNPPLYGFLFQLSILNNINEIVHSQDIKKPIYKYLLDFCTKIIDKFFYTIK